MPYILSYVLQCQHLMFIRLRYEPSPDRSRDRAHEPEHGTREDPGRDPPPPAARWRAGLLYGPLPPQR